MLMPLTAPRPPRLELYEDDDFGEDFFELFIVFDGFTFDVEAGWDLPTGEWEVAFVFFEESYFGSMAPRMDKLFDPWEESLDTLMTQGDLQRLLHLPVKKWNWR